MTKLNILLFWGLSIFYAQTLAAQGLPAGLTQMEQRYNACLSLVETRPEKALNEALAFKADHGGIPARHCEALSLAALGEQAEAAARLNLIASDLENSRGLPRVDGKAPAASPYLVAQIWHQAANAWALAGENSRAEAAIDRGLSLIPAGYDLENDLRITRARIAAALNDFDTAYRDLSLALKADPQNFKLHLLLASAARQTGRFDEALGALEIYQKSYSDDPVGWLERGHLFDLQGKKSDAQKAYLKVLDLLEMGDTADAARLALQKLALTGD